LNKYKKIPEKIVKIQKNIDTASDELAERKKALEDVKEQIAGASGINKIKLQIKMRAIEAQIGVLENEIKTLNSIIDKRKIQLEEIDKK